MAGRSTSEKTTYMILRKTPFRDTSLIVAGISPDFGRLDFMLRGARSIGKKSFPIAGVFREYSISFRPSSASGGMSSLVSMELLATHDRLAESMACYLAACDMASMLIRIAPPMLEIPYIWKAFSVMLSRMERTGTPEPARMLARLVCLKEHGGLSEFVPFAETLPELFRCALDAESDVQNIPQEQIDRMISWVDTALRSYHF